MYCARCSAELPREANFCMGCGTPQRSEVLEQRLAEISAGTRRMARWLMVVVGVIFMGLLLWVASRSSYSPWREPTFWVAVVGIVVACVVVPHIVWRERPGDRAEKKEALDQLVTMAPLAFVASLLLMLLWGGRVVYTLTVGGGPVLAGAAIVMMAGNAALTLGFARAIEGSDAVRPGWERARRAVGVLIGAQVLVNGVAEVLWGIGFRI